ncbi:MAG: cytochrome c [Candidatus Schekmanbacteria bacterium]|nr:cytochrome c [Candidatus Schekmanbacteria bacterium]
MRKMCSFLSLLLCAGLLSCSKSSETKQQVTQLETVPNSDDPLQPLMSKTHGNIDILLYGLMNFDKKKIEESVANISQASQYLAGQTQFQFKGSSAEWEALCADLQESAESIKENYLKEEYDKASVALGKLVTSCVNCHRPYRFGR